MHHFITRSFRSHRFNDLTVQPVLGSLLNVPHLKSQTDWDPMLRSLLLASVIMQLTAVWNIKLISYIHLSHTYYTVMRHLMTGIRS